MAITVKLLVTAVLILAAATALAAPTAHAAPAGVDPDAPGAPAWCRDQGFDRDHCVAGVISTTRGVPGSTAYN